MQEDIVNAEKEARKNHQMQLSQELGHQMKEFEARRQADKLERKEKVLTSGGPTQEYVDVPALNKKANERKVLVRLDLTKQRDMDKHQIDVKRQIEIEQEK